MSSLREALLDGAFTAGRCREWCNLHGMGHRVVERNPEQKGFVVLAGRWAEQPKVPRARARGMAAEGVERRFGLGRAAARPRGPPRRRRSPGVRGRPVRRQGPAQPHGSSYRHKLIPLKQPLSLESRE